MSKLRSQSGVALIIVMAVIAGFSLYMLNAASTNKLKSNRLALDFTIAQTNSILNAAYSYRTKSGKWPSTSSDNCWLPDNSNFLNLSDAVSNGWGHDLIAEDTCDDDGVYGIVQTVPEKYAIYFQNAFDNTENQGQGSGPDGTVRILISVDQYGDSQWFFEHGEMSDRWNRPYRRESRNCGQETANYIYGINAICAAWGTQYQRHNTDSGFNEYSEYNDGANAGYKMRIDNRDLYYDIYAVYEDVNTDSDTGTVTVSYDIESDRRFGGGFWNNYINDEGSSSDGHRYADESCPRSGPRIRNIVLSWCE